MPLFRQGKETAMQLNTMAVGQRLALGFGAVLALMVVLTMVGVGQVRNIDRALTTMGKVNSVKQRYAINFRGSVHDRSIALRDVVLAEDQATVDGNNALIDRLAADYLASAGPLYAMVDDPANTDAEEKRILQTIRGIEEHTLALVERTRELRARGEVDAARALVLGEAAPAFVTWLARINELIDLEEAKNHELAATAGAGASEFAWLMLVLCAVALALGGVLGWRISRSVAKPLRKALEVVRRVGAGDLGSRIHPRGNDETAKLLSAMARMQQQLVEFCDAQREIAARHEDGQISHRMREDFPGVYGAMATDINELVGSHIDLKMRLAEMLARYGTGDFTAILEPLPGEKARLNEVMETARDNLTAISTEIKHLSSAAAAGDFSARGDAHRFEAGFREMVSDLNHLMTTAEDNLAAVSAVFGALARGDLTVRMDAGHPGVFGQIGRNASGTGERLAEIVRDIQAAVGSIQLASSEIAAGNADLSRRTEQQAASLEETSTLMGELTDKVRRNAEHAHQANELARDAVQAATDGGEVVQEVVATMDAISGSAHRIADIIGVIDGIAFQTNILALNASVEAARAGEQGRGFAVVASEVRELAQRSAGAARDIKALIGESVRNVEAGSERVSRAGETMARLVGAVHGVTGIMGEITAASAQQHAGIEQVGERVQRLEEVTRQNASLVEEAGAAANGLAGQATGLARAVEVFRIDGGTASHPALLESAVG
ncbi:methyl-accepting chemotaxis protein [Lysobacter sp. GX 14042]|uniref:methyl-accepting chemotaxis protein n=1 Tax=Lysobacter sp. GX 14042 TaxID=2907155 RepID=UPI001F45006A|nr:methyl-accepting chemotaxis protein [Lysobacter sp. GX 14042]MCE7032921.1 methyl-accepting chemotaxis protein [Lysobacter sp. GX 14042]